MALLTAKKEVVAVTEDIVGSTPSSGDLTSAANADVLLNSAEPTLDVEFFDREYLRSTISKLKSIPGQKTGGVSMTFEMLGNSDDAFASGVPAWSKFMEMAGFRLVALHKVALDTQTSWSAGDGPIRHGEIITDTTGGDTARVVGDVHFQSGTGYIYYEPVSGTMDDGETWTTSDTELSVAVDSIQTNCGWAWVPVSEPWKQIDISNPASTVSVGAVYKGATSGETLVVAKEASTSATELVYRAGSGTITGGETLNLQSGSGPATLTVAATTNETFYQWPTGSIRLNEDGVALDFAASRASVSWQFEVNRPVLMTVTTRGRWDSPDTGSDLDGVGDTPLVGGAPTVVDPKLWAGQATLLGLNETLAEMDEADAMSPCLKTLSVDAGVTLTDVKCANAVDGLKEIVGSSRSASGSLEADATLEAEIPWLTTFRSGEVMRVSVQVGGSSGDPENGFVLQMPAIQYTGASSGDSDGILTRNMDFSVNGAVINNLGATPDGEISSTSGDNEIVLMYITD